MKTINEINLDMLKNIAMFLEGYKLGNHGDIAAGNLMIDELWDTISAIHFTRNNQSDYIVIPDYTNISSDYSEGLKQQRSVNYEK